MGITRIHVMMLLEGAVKQEKVFWEGTSHREIVISYELPTRGNFTVIGRAACNDAEEFDIQIGRQKAMENAAVTLTLLEGYLDQLIKNNVIKPEWLNTP